MKIDISKKVTYFKALLMPFHVTPLITALSIVDSLLKLGLVPLGVLATANFIDSSLLAIQNRSAENRTSAILWLSVILFIKLYYYIEEPLMNLISRKKQEKEWRLIDYPAMKLQASIDLKHFENSETSDLISRMCRPAGALCGMLGHLLSFIVFVGGILSYIVILLINAPLTGCIILGRFCSYRYHRAYQCVGAV